jgi:hypothetical protein
MASYWRKLRPVVILNVPPPHAGIVPARRQHLAARAEPRSGHLRLGGNQAGVLGFVFLQQFGSVHSL